MKIYLEKSIINKSFSSQNKTYFFSIFFPTYVKRHLKLIRVEVQVFCSQFRIHLSTP